MVSGVVHQKFGFIIDGHIIYSTLHWAKEMTVKMWDVNGLSDHKLIHFVGLQGMISKAPTKSGVDLSIEGWVVTFDNNRSVIIMENEGAAV